MANPVENILKAIRLQAVDAHPPLLPPAHEARFLQNRQMFGDRRLADGEARLELFRRKLSVGEQIEDAATRLIGYHMENVGACGKAVHGSFKE